ISYVGGIDSNGRAIDNRTPSQKESILKVLGEIYKELRQYQDVSSILIRGHRDFSPDKNDNGELEADEWLKSCPCFDVLTEYGWLQGTEAINKGRVVFK